MSQGSDFRHDATLPREERRALGAYYTPPAVVQYVVGETLTADLWKSGRSPRVLDPACGDGAFLCEVAQRLESASDCRRSLFGIDIDPQAVSEARLRVARSVLGENASEAQIAALAGDLAKNIVVSDALCDPLPPHWPQSFDAIVGNPPYVNIRRLAKRDEARVAEYRRRFRCATRGFDLYVLFIERALELLRVGGRCGLIVPNKLATLDYSAACRTLLVSETRMETIADLSDAHLFQSASVYPHVVVFEKREPKGGNVRVVRPQEQTAAGRLWMTPVASIEQSQLNRRGVFAWNDALDVESRVPTQPLGELCTLHSGTTGFVAQEIACELRERTQRGEGYPFITSGNIDRYEVRVGNVRYMKRTFVDPLLPRDSSLLSPAKRRLFGESKIVVAGMSRRLEAAWHAGPLALGVQVFAAARIQVDPFFLLVVLNSALLSHLFRTRFSAKRLAGGYLAINKGQLAQLPIAAARKGEKLHDHLARLARKLSSQGPNVDLEAEVDRLVARLYCLSEAEAEEIATTSPAFESRRAA